MIWERNALSVRWGGEPSGCASKMGKGHPDGQKKGQIAEVDKLKGHE